MFSFNILVDVLVSCIDLLDNEIINAYCILDEWHWRKKFSGFDAFLGLQVY